MATEPSSLSPTDEALTRAMAQMRLTCEILDQAQESLESERCKLNQERATLEEEKRAVALLMAKGDDIIELNVGGERISTSRSTLCLVEGSVLAAMFSGRWEEQLRRDSQGLIFLDMNPYCMKKLINHLRDIRLSGPEPIDPPQISPDCQKSWLRFLEFLGVKEFIYPISFLQVGRDMRFTRGISAVVLEQGGRKATNASRAGHRGVVCEPAMTQMTHWRYKIHRLHNNGWIMLGVNSSLNETDSYDADSTYGWACHGQVYKPHFEDGYGGWTTFVQGDEVIMKLDTATPALIMRVPRLSRTLHLNLPSSPAWYAYVNLHGGYDSVELLPATEEDVRFFMSEKNMGSGSGGGGAVN